MKPSRFTPVHRDDPQMDPAATVMSDMVWNLMIIMLVACLSLVPASMATLNEVDFDLARGNGTDDVEEHENTLRLTVDETLLVKLDDTTLGLLDEVEDSVGTAISQAISETGADTFVYVVPASSVDWQDVIRVHDAVSNATDNCTLVIEKEDES